MQRPPRLPCRVTLPADMRRCTSPGIVARISARQGSPDPPGPRVGARLVAPCGAHQRDDGATRPHAPHSAQLPQQAGGNALQGAQADDQDVQGGRREAHGIKGRRHDAVLGERHPHRRSLRFEHGRGSDERHVSDASRVCQHGTGIGRQLRDGHVWRFWWMRLGDVGFVFSRVCWGKFAVPASVMGPFLSSCGIFCLPCSTFCLPCSTLSPSYLCRGFWV